MEDFVSFLIKKIIDKPERVTIEKIDDPELATLVLKIDQSDCGRVIGKRGKTINAIRNLLNLYRNKNKLEPEKKVILKVEESLPS